MWQEEIGIFPVAWPGQCDEWQSHLSQILSGRDDLGRMGLPAEGNYGAGEVILGPPSFGSPVRSSMRVTPHPDGIACVVFSADEDTSDQDQIRPWRDAAAAAVAELGRHDQDFAWQAILGPHPCSPEWLRFGPLRQQETIGPVQLAPGGILMRELTGPARARIDTPWPADYTWPIIASGAIRTYDPDDALYLSRHYLHRVCAILSLITARYWLPRSGPDVQRPGWPQRGPMTVPQSIGPWDHTGHPDSSLPADFNTYTGDTPLTVPPWTASAWTLLDNDDVTRASLDAYYEAIGMEMDHPSAAFLFYVAAIEGIGTRLEDLERCETCNADKGAARRFRKALKTVLTNKQAKELEYAYRIRSKTGHEGRLFGTEHTFGYTDFSMFQPDWAGVFDLQALGQIRNATRQVIAKILRDAAR